ncbi:hypothetical protein Tco_1143187 [Tanacetum coccineum]
MFVVCACARYQVNPKVSHLHAVKRIFSDYAEERLDRKSTVGGCQFLRSRLIAWQCKKQTVVANSTTEAEYVAASSCCGQAKIVNGEVQLQALVDGKKIIITETIVRRDLQLEDAESVDFLPNATIFEQLTLMGSKRKDTEVPQPSGPITNVADEAVNEEMDDSLVRAATTASSLEVELDSGNINKTQVPQELVQVVVLGANKPWGIQLLRLELMALCTTLQSKVLALETTKPTQANEITGLKRRVKKLEKRNKSRTHGLKILYKVGLSRRVESSDEEGLSGEDASIQGRIADIDANKYIYLVNVHTDEDMFGVNDLDGDEVIVDNVDVVETAEETVNVVVTIVSISSTIPVSAATTTTTTTTTVGDVEITLAQALAELKSAKPKADKVVIQEPEQGTTTTTPTTIIFVPKPLQDKGKGIMIEEHVVEQLLAEEEEEEEEEGLAREKAQQIKEANIAWDDIQAKIEADFQLAQRLQAQEREEEQTTNKSSTKEYHVYLSEKHGRIEDQKFEEQLEQESSKKQKVEEDKETSKLQSIIEIVYDEEEVSIDAIPLATKPPTIVYWKIHKEGKNSYYQIIRADGSSKIILLVILKLLMKKLNDFGDKYQVYGRIVGIKSLFRVTTAQGGDLIRRYSTSMTKKKVATYELKWIKDLVPELWSPVQLKYNQHAYLGTSHWGPKCQSFYGYASNLTSSKDVYSRRRIIAVTRLKIMMKYDQSLLEEIEVRRDDQKLYTFKEGDFKRLRLQDIEDIRIVIQRRVEDLQLGVESYQKKLNLTKLDTYRSNLKNKTAYTSYSDPHEMIYMDQYKRKRLMRADELHKFSDGMLNDVRSARHDIAARIRMEYLPMRK